MVQYDHLKICPPDSNNTGILVMIDHFFKFAEVVHCSHEDHDAVQRPGYCCRNDLPDTARLRACNQTTHQFDCKGVQRVHEGIPGHKSHLYSGSAAHPRPGVTTKPDLADPLAGILLALRERLGTAFG